MDEISEKAIETSVTLMVQPIAGIVGDIVGLGGGDWLHEKREQNRQKLRHGTRQFLEERAVPRVEEPNPITIAPIIAAAQDESREELQEIWARLLAAALDPGRNQRYRREYVDVVKQLEPTDVRVLSYMVSAQPPVSEVNIVSETCKIPSDQVLLSFHNLIRVGCCMGGAGQEAFPPSHVHVSPLSRELIALLQ